MLVNVSEALARLYLDKCNILRYGPIGDGDFTQFGYSPLYNNISCGYSQDKRNVMEGDVSKKILEHKLFCTPDTDLMEGDQVEVFMDGYPEKDKKVFKVLSIFKYDGSHLEASLKLEVYE